MKYFNYKSFLILVLIILIPISLQSQEVDPGSNTTVIQEPPSQEKLFLIAVGKNQIKQVKKFLEDGTSPNATDELGNFALHIAIQKKYRDLVNLLLESGADPNLKNNEKITPLYLAIVSKDLKIIQILLKYPINISVPSGEDSIFPITLAYELRRVDILKLLLEKTKLTDEVTSKSRIPLIMDAIEKNRKSELELFLQYGGNPNSQMADGTASIVYCIQKGYSQLTAILLKNGVSVETKDSEGKSLILIAHESYIKQRSQERMNIFFQLLDAKANIETVTSLERTFLQDYTEKGWDTLVAKLISYGANTNVIEKNGNQLIHLASISGSSATLLLILKNGGNIEALGDRKYKPIHYAVERSFANIVKILIDNKADINAKNDKGDTPLSLSIRIQNLSIAKQLLQSGADKNGTTAFGNPILLDVCGVDSFNTSQKTYDLLDVLLQAGIDINSKNIYGNNCLFYSINRKNVPMLNYLLKKGADPNLKDNLGYNSIHKIVLSALFDRLKNDKLEEIFYTMVNSGANINDIDQLGNTPLQLAVLKRNGVDNAGALQIIQILLDANALINIKNKENDTAVDLAKYNEVFSNLLDSNRIEKKEVQNFETPNISQFKINSSNKILLLSTRSIPSLEIKFSIFSKSGKIDFEKVLQFGDSISSTKDDSVWIAGVAPLENDGISEKKCKLNENLGIFLRNLSIEGEEQKAIVESKLGSCKNTSVISLDYNPLDGNIYLSVKYGSERILIAYNSQGEKIYETKISGNWTGIQFLKNGNLVTFGDRYQEISLEGKIVKTFWHKKINGIKSSAMDSLGNVYYASILTQNKKDSLVLSKYKENNSLEWKKTYLDFQNGKSITLQTDTNDNLVVTGEISSSVHGNMLSSPSGNFFMLVNSEGLRKYTYEWNRTFDSDILIQESEDNFYFSQKGFNQIWRMKK